MSQATSALQGENYINLETFKRSGEGVKTPVWFAHQGEELVFMTNGKSWKCKRLARNADCKFAACGVAGGIKGPWFDGQCVKIEDAAAVTSAADLLSRKYGLQWKLLLAGAGLANKKKDHLYYRITPS
jgi:uncharacterized protein